jgi:hypothetical protein
MLQNFLFLIDYLLLWLWLWLWLRKTPGMKSMLSPQMRQTSIAVLLVLVIRAAWRCSIMPGSPLSLSFPAYICGLRLYRLQRSIIF